MSPAAPSAASTLSALTQPRILDLGRVFGVRLRSTSAAKKQLASTLGTQLEGRLPLILRELGREELQAVCRAHDLAHSSSSRRELIETLLVAAGFDPSASVPPPPEHHRDGLPRAGQIVRARHRQWLVEHVDPGEADESARLSLVCLDDDDPGRRLDVLWDLELGAQTIEPERRGLSTPGTRLDRLDPPAYFGAYLHALRWNAVSAADATRFQAPFRAGIEHLAHQLTPLMKALELPRANLFIADDVGLGKTIEAGLVMQELILRQQADFILIACPSSICLQWQSEMRRRFGLHFEVMTRAFVAQKRQQRGFGVNPWSTHHRFIVSHSLLRRPEYREPLQVRLGNRARKSLFVLDEAHVAAPATRSLYAVDSEITRTVRDLAPRFDNRLFLSATPHNGHSNSFSALLEILDPIRFTRGVPVQGKGDLAPIMVRRLKRDLKKMGVDSMPERVLVKLELAHDAPTPKEGRWSATAHRSDHSSPITHDLGPGSAVDLDLARMLARYTELCAPDKGPGRLPFIRLQQRLLSSPEAFAKSLEVHARAIEKQGGPVVRATQTSLEIETSDPELHGPSDEALQAEDDARLAQESAALPTPTEEAIKLLTTLRATADKARHAPDAKVRALLAWMREHLCPSIGAPHDRTSHAWSERRVLIFTEWADTKRYLVDLLREAIAHTDDAEDRIASFSGGMGDDAREEIQRRFNADPSEEPLRILVATDAAREGINLQAHCADLFHIDLPWNPGRLEQRNGRIDRTLQPQSEVRCHYFVYTERPEDRVLETLVRKIDVVQRELGSLGAVLMDELEAALSTGIRAQTRDRIEPIGKDRSTRTIDAELEDARKDEKTLRDEIARAGRRYDASRKALEVSPEILRQVVDVGLRMAGTEGLVPQDSSDPRSHETQRARYRLPALDRSWDVTIDTLRPPRPRGEPLFEWRRRPPLPVTFSPIQSLTSDVEQLHLAHPLTKRVLDRFLAQGFSAHDLRRVASVIDPESGEPSVIAYGRLTLFGAGAARLHDEIVAIAAPWDGGVDTASTVVPHPDRVTSERIIRGAEARLAAGVDTPGATVTSNIARAAEQLLAALWRPLEDEADARAVAAKNGLLARAREESDQMHALLERQRKGLRKSLLALDQGDLFAGLADSADAREQRRQHELDRAHMLQREREMAAELEREPAAIAALYEVKMTRLSPVGLVVSWPRSWT